MLRKMADGIRAIDLSPLLKDKLAFLSGMKLLGVIRALIFYCYCLQLLLKSLLQLCNLSRLLFF